MTEPDEQLMTSAEVAELFQVDRRTVTRYARDGLLPAIRLPGGYRFAPGKVRAALAAMQTGKVGGHGNQD